MHSLTYLEKAAVFNGERFRLEGCTFHFRSPSVQSGRRMSVEMQDEFAQAVWDAFRGARNIIIATTESEGLVIKDV